MRQRKLRFSNRWMFNRVMLDESVCRHVVQAILGIEIERIDYLNAEQVIEPDPDSHGVRMDVYVRESGADRVYDLEMQAVTEPSLGKRFRYYQSALDTRELPVGKDYDQLPESFIVFLCSSDAFGYDVPVYRLERCCEDVPDLRAGDLSHWVVLNAQAWEEAREGDLLDLLRYVQTGKAVGSLSREIDEVVARSNKDRKWVEKVFSISTIEENDARRRRIELRMARAEGLEEGRAEGLEEGMEQGQRRFAALADWLIENGRVDDLKRAANDDAFCEELFREMGQ